MNKEPLITLADFGLDKKLKEIWTDDGYSPVYQENVRKNVVTFLSLNPSLPPNERKKATQGNNVHPPFPMIDFKQGSPYPFFKKYYEIGKKFSEPWTAIDLLYIRDSSQKKIEEIYKTDRRNFITTQVQLTLEIIKEIQPKVVVVANRFVETLLLEYQPFKGIAHLDEKEIYRYEGIPFIMRESGFMGSRRIWESKSQKSLSLKKKMFAEIRKVLIKLTEQEIEMLPMDKMGVYKSRKYEEVIYWRDRKKYLVQHLKELTDINC